MKLTVALGQMDVQLGKPATNLACVRRMTAVSAQQGADLVVFPELWSTGYDLENAAQYATPVGEGIFGQVAALARQQQVHLIGSNLSRMGDGAFGNTAVLYNNRGDALGDYSKVHLFRLMKEDQFLAAGQYRTVVETVWGKVGIAICYDLRFPELFRSYALAGTGMVVIPAEWPHPRLMHWQTLLRARAIENQMFIVACNRVGCSQGSDFCGHSCVIDPWGEVLVEGDESEGVLTAVIDTTLVDDVRSRIPVFADRRPEVYGER